MNPQRLAELRAAYAAMTEGPHEAVLIECGNGTPEAVAAALGKSALATVNPVTQLHAVLAHCPSRGDVTVAYTGNGPTSSANADGIAAILNAMPEIFAALEERGTR